MDTDDSVRLKFCKSTVNRLYYSDLVHSFQVQRKIHNVQKLSKYYIEFCIHRYKIGIKWLQEILQQLDSDYGECAMKIALLAWVGYRAGMQFSLAPFFQSIYCTVLMKNSAAYPQLSTALRG